MPIDNLQVLLVDGSLLYPSCPLAVTGYVIGSDGTLLRPTVPVPCIGLAVVSDFYRLKHPPGHCAHGEILMDTASYYQIHR